MATMFPIRNVADAAGLPQAALTSALQMRYFRHARRYRNKLCVDLAGVGEIAVYTAALRAGLRPHRAIELAETAGAEAQPIIALAAGQISAHGSKREALLATIAAPGIALIDVDAARRTTFAALGVEP